MNIELLLALLKNTLSGTVNTITLSNETRTPVKVVEHDVLSLARNGLVTSVGRKEIEISVGQRLNLAVFALARGADVERVCRSLGWKEFEDLVALALEHNECRVKKHFRFKGLKRKYEIDVIGLKEPLIFSVECKRWKRSWRRAATIDAIRMQVERTEALAQYLPEPNDRLGVARWRDARLMPLVLTLSNTPLKIFEGVPVVPIFYFNSFLNEMRTYTDKLMFFKMKPKNQES